MKFGMAAVASVIQACTGNSSFSDQPAGRGHVLHPTITLNTIETRNNQEATPDSIFSFFFIQQWSR